MAKGKTNEKALYMSLAALLLCTVMLVGSTFAWFTDSGTVGVNKIVSGTLDIELLYKNAVMGQFKDVSADSTDLFVNSYGSQINWGPGVVSVCYFKVENRGNLDLKYLMYLNYEDVSQHGDIKLSDALRTAIIEWDGETPLTREEAIAAANAGGTADNLALQNVQAQQLKADTSKYCAMVVYMPAETGNQYNLPAGASPLKIQLGINLLAGQLNSEIDSFGPDYDKDAPFPTIDSDKNEEPTPND